MIQLINQVELIVHSLQVFRIMRRSVTAGWLWLEVGWRFQYMVSIWIIYGWSMDNLWIIYGSGRWLSLPLWKIWKSVGMIIPNIWKNKHVPNHQLGWMCTIHSCICLCYRGELDTFYSIQNVKGNMKPSVVPSRRLQQSAIQHHIPAWDIDACLIGGWTCWVIPLNNWLVVEPTLSEKYESRLG